MVGWKYSPPLSRRLFLFSFLKGKNIKKREKTGEIAENLLQAKLLKQANKLLFWIKWTQFCVSVAVAAAVLGPVCA